MSGSIRNAVASFFGKDAPESPMGTAPDAVTEGSAEASVVEALRTVIDPEVGINVVDLGLVYGVSVADGRVDVAMTMTTPACPLGPLIRSQARRAIEDATPEAEVDVHLVWDPPWSSERVSLLGRRQLGLID